MNSNGIEYEDDDSQQAYTREFWIGIGVSVITNLVQSFAMAFQRKSHILNDTVYPVEARKHSLKRPMWVVSFAAFLTANIIGSIFSIGYLPIVILAPIGAMGLVFNAVAAKIVLGDPFKRNTVVGNEALFGRRTARLIVKNRYTAHCRRRIACGFVWRHPWTRPWYRWLDKIVQKASIHCLFQHIRICDHHRFTSNTLFWTNVLSYGISCYASYQHG